MCVCVGSPVKGGGFVKHVIPIAKFSPPRCPFHTLGLSSTTPQDPQGGMHKGVPTSPSPPPSAHFQLFGGKKKVSQQKFQRVGNP
jgi:hypothetical protein